MSAVQETVPAGYFESLAKLRKPDDWDTSGLIEDARAIAKREDHSHVLAVIDYLRDSQSRDLIRELLVACKVGLSLLRHSGIVGRSPETDTLEAAIQRAEQYTYRN
jgi:HEAT repeat protein